MESQQQLPDGAQREHAGEKPPPLAIVSKHSVDEEREITLEQNPQHLHMYSPSLHFFCCFKAEVHRDRRKRKSSSAFLFLALRYTYEVHHTKCSMEHNRVQNRFDAPRLPSRLT